MDMQLHGVADAVPIELKEAGDGVPEDITKALATLTETVDARLKAVETKSVDATKLTDRLDRLEAKLNRPGLGATTEETPKLETKAWAGYLRHGREALAADEVKTLRVSDDTAGGYLATTEFSTDVLKGIVEFSPVRQAARVGTTAAGSVILPKRTGKPTAAWVSEIGTRTATESAYGQLEVPNHEMSCYVDVSTRLLEDSAISVEGEISFDLSEEFGRLEGVSFLTGDGVGKPLGLLNSGLSYVANGHATTLSADALISIFYALPAYYRNRGAWMLNGSTLATIRKFKEATTGAYIWQPAYAAGQPETILGRPVIEAVDMPNIGEDALPIIFGDFATAYRIYDRVALSVMRDPYSQATNGIVRFHARRRVGGGLVMGEALRTLKMATS